MIYFKNESVNQNWETKFDEDNVGISHTRQADSVSFKLIRIDYPYFTFQTVTLAIVQILSLVLVLILQLDSNHSPE